MSNQRLFDEALSHIRKQRCQSMLNGACCYDNSEGLSCAFAPAIKAPIEGWFNSKQAKWFYEETEQTHLLHEWARDAKPLLAECIQRCHDSWGTNEEKDFMEYFEEGMARVAARFGLTYTPE